MSQSVRPGRGAALPVALVGAALLSTGTVGMAFADDAPQKQPSRGEQSRSQAANDAAAYVVKQLDGRNNGLRDPGLTADAILGLAATGTSRGLVGRATEWLKDKTETEKYLYPRKGRLNVEGAAKIALALAVQGQDPNQFGKYRLVELIQAEHQKDGRYGGEGENGPDKFGQAWAIMALKRAGELPGKNVEIPEDAVAFLIKDQCLSVPPKTVGKSAKGAKSAPLPDSCGRNVDSVSLAVQALLAVHRGDEAELGLKWLEDHKGTDNGFSHSGIEEAVSNSGSTALAVEALVAGGHKDLAEKGIKWLHDRQGDCAGGLKDLGAIDHTNSNEEAKLRATARALPALSRQPLYQIDGTNLTKEDAEATCRAEEGTSGGTGGKSTESSSASPKTKAPSPADTSPAPSDSESASPTPTDTATATATATSDTGASGSTSGSGGTTGTGTTSGSSGSTASDSLARTGADAAFPAAIGAGALMVTGAGAMAVARKRRGSAQ